jgi:NhaP-type Na+/H+ or K+/H+ antiporter
MKAAQNLINRARSVIWLVAACALLTSFPICVAASTPVVRVGLVLPNMTDPDVCFGGLSLLSGALNFTARMNLISGPQFQMELVALPGATPFEAFQSVQNFLDSPTPCGASVPNTQCDVVHSAVVGAPTSLGSEYLQLTTHREGVPLFGYAATAVLLTSPSGSTASTAQTPQFLRYCQTDLTTTAAIWETIEHFKWGVVNVVYEENSPTALGILESIQTIAREKIAMKSTAIGNDPATIVLTVPFNPADEESVDQALEELAENEVRLIVVAATDEGSSTLMERAVAKNMVGKGWTWVGGQSMRPTVFGGYAKYSLENPSVDVEGRAYILDKLSGVLAVLPHGVAGVSSAGSENTPKVTIPRVFSSASSAPYPTTNDASAMFPPPSTATCPLVQLCMSTGANPNACQVRHSDVLLSFVQDALSSIAQAVASQLSTPPLTCASTIAATRGLQALCPEKMIEKIRYLGETTTQLNVSQATDEKRVIPRFTSGGDRRNLPIHLVLYQPGGNAVALANWVPDQGVDPVKQLSKGEWEFVGAPVWPDFDLGTPSDRVMESHNVDALVFMTFAVGIVLATFLGHTCHHSGCAAIPESAVTVATGAAVGIIMFLANDERVVKAARFDEEVFALVMLPIIIAESGLVLDKHPFFTQLWSILTFAVFGTLIATLIIGGGLFGLGQIGWVLPLTSAEAMTFAALISAVDPVATLVVFSSLGVDPRLNSLVYGEAVVNDAVAIVLFEASAHFISNPVDGPSLGEAIGTFFLVMIGSLIVGGAFGFITTLFFRFFRPVSALPDEHDATKEEDVSVRPDKARSKIDDEAAKPAAKKSRFPVMFWLGRRIRAKPETAQDEDMDEEPKKAHHHVPVDVLPPPGTCRRKYAIEDPFGVIQATIVLIMAYASFSAAEAMHLSGIVSSLFAGIAMNHWLARAMSHTGRMTTFSVFRVLASLADNTIFFLIGVNAVLYSGKFDFGLTFATILLCLLGRVFSVFPLAMGLNCFRKEPISRRWMSIMWVAGLRGAIAYATAVRFPTQHRDEIVSATTYIVIFTIFVLGTLTEPALGWLGIPVGVIPESNAEARSNRLKMNAEAQKESPTKRAIAWCDRALIRPLLYAPEVRNKLHHTPLSFRRHASEVGGHVAGAAAPNGEAGPGGEVELASLSAET